MQHFDFHFHLLTKHSLSNGVDVNKVIRVNGITKFLNDIFGGPFESQAAPAQVVKSNLYFGVNGVNAIELAFVQNMLNVLNLYDLRKNLPFDQQMLDDVRAGRTSYNKLFEEQLAYNLSNIGTNEAAWNIKLLNRTEDMAGAKNDIANVLADPAHYSGSRWLVFSIEGGHNLAKTNIKSGLVDQAPEQTLKVLQDRSDVDFISINLCHLSYIPELPLGGFAQGLNHTAQFAFRSEDFFPFNGPMAGLTALGKKVIRQALLHDTKPILIDVKHMSLYTRLHYYRYKEQLGKEAEKVKRLPIISSHTGFTFNTIQEFIDQSEYRYSKATSRTGRELNIIEPMERRIGKTNDLLNNKLYGNPWTINLFDDEIAEIMHSGGLIGLSLDQRVLGTEKIALDGHRPDYYEGDHLSGDEYKKLFVKREPPTAEGLQILPKNVGPLPRERHAMLLALHMVHAVRVGLANGVSGDPWSYLCIGSDFDGLINPINSVQNVEELPNLEQDLHKYLPQADRTLPYYTDYKALKYTADGSLNTDYLEGCIQRVLLKNGLSFLQRFINNWH